MWSIDELMTLSEASLLFWPDGPLTVTSLRTAVRHGQLDIVEIAGKLLTTKSAIQRMSACGPRSLKEGSTQQDNNRAEAAPRTVAEFRRRRSHEA